MGLARIPNVLTVDNLACGFASTIFAGAAAAVLMPPSIHANAST
jgi:hypothetical protein